MCHANPRHTKAIMTALRLRRLGKPIGDMDLLIGSTALRHNLSVLTNNRRHFGLIDGLALESWQAAPGPSVSQGESKVAPWRA